MAEEQHTGRNAPSQARVTRENYCKATAVKAVCAQCGKGFTSIRRGHKHCSPKCAIKAYHHARVKVPGPRKCDRCKSLFTPKTIWHTFCSSECRDRKAKLTTEKSCVICASKFTPPIKQIQRYCSVECRLKGYALAASKYRERSRTAGTCFQCPQPQLPSVTLCEKHWFQKALRGAGFAGRGDAEKGKRLMREQNCRCPYTGVELVLGVNASIDHKNPTSRFPGQARLWENIEWVDLSVNSAKRALTKDEFISLCKTVALRA